MQRGNTVTNQMCKKDWSLVLWGILVLPLKSKNPNISICFLVNIACVSIRLLLLIGPAIPISLFFFSSNPVEISKLLLNLTNQKELFFYSCEKFVYCPLSVWRKLWDGLSESSFDYFKEKFLVVCVQFVWCDHPI